MYGKLVVASKVPLPSYRPDFDDKRPQREVFIPLSLQRRVEGLLEEHIDGMQFKSGDVASNTGEDLGRLSRYSESLTTCRTRKDKTWICTSPGSALPPTD